VIVGRGKRLAEGDGGSSGTDQIHRLRQRGHPTALPACLLSDLACSSQLDFVYQPSRDVAADVEYYTGALDAEFVFAAERFGTRVAMVWLTSDAPRLLLLAEHLEGAARPRALDSGLRRTTQDLGPGG
jgi:hypothetical protein